jgi:hypothetical protein
MFLFSKAQTLVACGLFYKERGEGEGKKKIGDSRIIIIIIVITNLRGGEKERENK